LLNTPNLPGIELAKCIQPMTLLPVALTHTAYATSERPWHVVRYPDRNVRCPVASEKPANATVFQAVQVVHSDSGGVARRLLAAGITTR
jgi:hypothetical protein